MNPQLYEPVFESLSLAGALDVTLLPVIMKKSRPAVILKVLCEKKKEKKLLEILFRETTTLGVRSYGVTRFELTRVIRSVRTPYGPVEVKVGQDSSGRPVNLSPEFSSCLRLSKKRGIPLKKVYQAIFASSRA
jgi:hypothetical protein